MVFVFRDLDGIVHEFDNDFEPEVIIDIVTKNIVGYRAKSKFNSALKYMISAETFDAMKELEKGIMIKEIN